MFWAGYSCNFYLPSTIAPAGFTNEGLPVGVQIVGPQYGDYTCIYLAQMLEREFQPFVPPPGLNNHSLQKAENLLPPRGGGLRWGGSFPHIPDNLPRLPRFHLQEFITDLEDGIILG
jgi:hypothetical protein